MKRNVRQDGAVAEARAMQASRPSFATEYSLLATGIMVGIALTLNVIGNLLYGG